MNDLAAFFRSEWPEIQRTFSRWQSAFAVQTRAATSLVLELAAIGPGMRVLDLACGTGEPALSVARAVGPTGRVVVTDLVPEAAAFVAELARAARLTTVSAVGADAETLPFESASFDAVTCRLGVMFFREPERALAEARRVLKPGGRASFVAWGRPEQPLFQATLGALNQGLPNASEVRPGPFRFAKPKTLERTLAASGFPRALAREVRVPWPFPGPASEYWRAFQDLSGPSFGKQLDLLLPGARAELDRRVLEGLRPYEQSGVTDPGAVLVTATGFND